MKKIFIILFVMILQAGGATRPEYGIQSNIPDYYALINARIVTEPGKVIENGTIIFRNGVIENVGSKLSVPASARIVDLKGCSLYPGFIDPSVEKKSESPKKPGGMRRSAPVYTVDRKGGQHWNPTVHPEVSLKVDFTYDKKLQENYIKQGFTSIHLVSNDGLFSGSGAIADLGVSYSGDALIDTRPIQMMSLKKGTSKLDYPGSLMGSIALIRQSFMDAAWYDQA
ncbi:MAG: amidohydrolase, partial [Candidatus Marinimicrobia bacterium]|nr:amidohydrolase [Candidatus Neomarinimicrobiota bacterium]